MSDSDFTSVMRALGWANLAAPLLVVVGAWLFGRRRVKQPVIFALLGGLLFLGVTRVVGPIGFYWRYSSEAGTDVTRMGLAVLEFGTGQFIAAVVLIVPVLYALYRTVEKRQW